MGVWVATEQLKGIGYTGLQISKTAVSGFQCLKNELCIWVVQPSADLWELSATLLNPFLLRADTMSPLKSKFENDHMHC